MTIRYTPTDQGPAIERLRLAIAASDREIRDCVEAVSDHNDSIKQLNDAIAEERGRRFSYVEAITKLGGTP